jgi:predicted 2-oxoglutarate/Fe(II)-dependent dioxygenase YbiX
VNASTEWLFEFLCAVASEAAQAASGLKLTTINRAPQYVEYRSGWGHFDWHNDYSHGLPEAPRKLTIIVQLSRSSDYEGGRLQMFGAEVEDLPDERGVVIAFPSFLYHRVTPVTRGIRRALVAWIAGPRIR